MYVKKKNCGRWQIVGNICKIVKKGEITIFDVQRALLINTKKTSLSRKPTKMM